MKFTIKQLPSYWVVLSDEAVQDEDLVVPNDPWGEGDVWKFKTAPCPLPYWGNASACKKVVAISDPGFREWGAKVKTIPEEVVKFFESIRK